MKNNWKLSKRMILKHIDEGMEVKIRRCVTTGKIILEFSYAPTSFVPESREQEFERLNNFNAYEGYVAARSSSGEPHD
jgi:hypothetical protein